MCLRAEILKGREMNILQAVAKETPSFSLVFISFLTLYVVLNAFPSLLSSVDDRAPAV